MKRLSVFLLISLFIIYACMIPANSEGSVPTPSPIPSSSPLPAVSSMPLTTGTSASGYVCEYLKNGTVKITACCVNDQILEIPEYIDGFKVTAVGDYAFRYCSHLTVVIIPDSVISIGNNPFSECLFLSEIRISPDHPCYEVIDGVLFSKEDKRLVCCPCGISTSEYTVPEGTQTIGASAFRCCKNIYSVIIPASVSSIEECAFFACINLTDIRLSNNITSLEYATFYNCRNLYNIIIPGSVTRLEDQIFYCCTGLANVTLPASITSIKDTAFLNCSSDLICIVSHDSYAAQFCRDSKLNCVYSDINGQ